jgi:hypothetical protein
MSGEGFIGGPIWTHEKRGGDQILAGVREFEGHRFMDVRLWANGGTTPTRKGATIPLDAVASLARALAAYAAGNASSGPENGS